MHALIRFVVIAFTVVTLSLTAAVGVAAASGTFGASLSAPNVGAIFSGHIDLGFLSNFGGIFSNQGQHTGQCHPPKKVHKHGTPGHKNHPCGVHPDDSPA